MFATYSERTLLSLGPDVTVIFVIKNATLGMSGCRSKMTKNRKQHLKRNFALYIELLSFIVAYEPRRRYV